MASSLARFASLAQSIAALRLPQRLVPATTASKSTAMATYAASVTPTTGPVPDSAAAKAHHVLGRNGERVRFVNPYPSAGVPLSLTHQLSRMFRHVLH